MSDEQAIFDVVGMFILFVCGLAALWILPIVANPDFKLWDLWPFNRGSEGERDE